MCGERAGFDQDLEVQQCRHLPDRRGWLRGGEVLEFHTRVRGRRPRPRTPVTDGVEPRPAALDAPLTNTVGGGDVLSPKDVGPWTELKLASRIVFIEDPVFGGAGRGSRQCKSQTSIVPGLCWTLRSGFLFTHVASCT